MNFAAFFFFLSSRLITFAKIEASFLNYGAKPSLPFLSVLATPGDQGRLALSLQLGL